MKSCKGNSLPNADYSYTSDRKNISHIVNDLLLTVQHIITGCAVISNEMKNDYLEFQIGCNENHPTIFIHYQICLNDRSIQTQSSSDFEILKKDDINIYSEKNAITSNACSKFTLMVKENSFSNVNFCSFIEDEKYFCNNIDEYSLNCQKHNSDHTNIPITLKQNEAFGHDEIIIRKEIPEHLCNVNFKTIMKQSSSVRRRKNETLTPAKFESKTGSVNSHYNSVYNSNLKELLLNDGLLRNCQISDQRNEYLSQTISPSVAKENINELLTDVKSTNLKFKLNNQFKALKFNDKYEGNGKEEEREVLHDPEKYIKTQGVNYFEISDEEIAMHEINEENTFLKLNKEIELIFQTKNDEGLNNYQKKDDEFKEIVWLPVETVLGENVESEYISTDLMNTVFLKNNEQIKENENSVINYKSKYSENSLEIKSNEKFYKCKYCEKTFDFLTLKWQHEVIHKPHSCSHCERTFAHKCLKVQHEKIHITGISYACSYCEKLFSTLRQKKQHERIHTRDRPYVCRFCKKSFANASRRAGHEMIHTGERPYSCNYCGKSFNSKSSIHRHQRIHTGEKPYSCRHCDKRFANIGNKNKHERLHLKWGF